MYSSEEISLKSSLFSFLLPFLTLSACLPWKIRTVKLIGRFAQHLSQAPSIEQQGSPLCAKSGGHIALGGYGIDGLVKMRSFSVGISRQPTNGSRKFNTAIRFDVFEVMIWELFSRSWSDCWSRELMRKKFARSQIGSEEIADRHWFPPKKETQSKVFRKVPVMAKKKVVVDRSYLE